MAPLENPSQKSKEPHKAIIIRDARPSQQKAGHLAVEEQRTGNQAVEAIATDATDGLPLLAPPSISADSPDDMIFEDPGLITSFDRGKEVVQSLGHEENADALEYNNFMGQRTLELLNSSAACPEGQNVLKGAPFKHQKTSHPQVHQRL
ncbi:hypothetical protein J5N97_012642 [Dioscorea zingiberensis]|uniref:Uncharacterized protein n=1 Tax=Dioscorea zingiberensis TaxID=325984 RepID=A0A9D5CS29_9LILI|nr:hypothetical protein J5N97_012642 [Dioscorea zingiberensis]